MRPSPLTRRLGRRLPWLLGLVVVLLMWSPQPLRAGPACPDLLLGDSLAVGMAPHARAAGFLVIARGGAGIGWLQEQTPRCASRLLLVFGTNDLRGLRPEEAEAYLQRIAAVMERWPANRIVWATPGCFRRDQALEQGSRLLDGALVALRQQSSDSLRHLPAIHRGRQARCDYETPDGVHPTAGVYRSWWSSLITALDHGTVAATW